MDITIIAKRIKERSKERGVSVKTLLEQTETSRNLIYEIEGRGSCPSGETLLNLANYLDCSVDYLLGETDIPEVNRFQIQTKQEDNDDA